MIDSCVFFNAYLSRALSGYKLFSSDEQGKEKWLFLIFWFIVLEWQFVNIKKENAWHLISYLLIWRNVLYIWSEITLILMYCDICKYALPHSTQEL